MDAPPTRLMRWLQLGDADRAVAAESIWDCVSCQTCSARCPQGVDCAAVLDALREIAFARGAVAPGRQRIVAFQGAFLDNIRRNGRLNELELTALYKLRAFRHDRRIPLLFKDAGLAPGLAKRGKLRLKGQRAADLGVVARIFQRCGAGGAA
jgi:heterodisulfide reductase subunit C